MNNMGEEIRKLIQTMPVNYYKACMDTIENREWETVQNTIGVIMEKFHRNPDLHTEVDVEALTRADLLISTFINKGEE